MTWKRSILLFKKLLLLRSLWDKFAAIQYLGNQKEWSRAINRHIELFCASHGRDVAADLGVYRRAHCQLCLHVPLPHASDHGDGWLYYWIGLVDWDGDVANAVPDNGQR